MVALFAGEHAMIWENLIKHVCQPDPLEVAKARVQTRVVGKIIRERYEEIHGGALRRCRSSVPSRDAAT